MALNVDDYATVQAAFDAATPGSVVRFTPGATYPLAACVEVRGGITIEAHGATIQGDGTQTLLHNVCVGETYSGYGGHSGISVYGGVWDARGYLAPVGTLVVNALAFSHARGIRLVDVTVRNVAGAHAVELQGVNGAILDRCRFEGFADCTVGQTRQFSEAVQIDSPRSATSSGWPDHDDTHCRDVLITGCYMGPSADCGPFGALAGNHSDSTTSMYHEVIRVLGCYVESSLLYAVRPYRWRDSIVANNVFRDLGGTAVLDEQCAGLVVADNVIRRPENSGINVTGSADVVVSGNLVADTADNYGVYVSDSTDVLVAVNGVHNAQDAACRLAPGADRCVVHGNLLRRSAGDGNTAITCAGGAGTVNRVTHNDTASYGTGVSVTNGTVQQA